MVRQRKVANSQHKHGNNNEASGSSGGGEGAGTSRSYKASSVSKTGVGLICLFVAVYIGILGYLETRVNTPFDDEKVVQKTGLAVPEMYWGSYRPGVYFGLKTREPRSPVFGLMWYELGVTHKGIRHWCDQNDKLPSYGWTRHDGVTFGEQKILDPPHAITTSFVKAPGMEPGGHWTARINVTVPSKKRTTVGLVWYAALDEALGPAAPDSRLWMEGGQIMGQTPQLGNFRVSFVPHTGTVMHSSHAEAVAPGLHVLKEKFLSLLLPSRESYDVLGQLAILDEGAKLKENGATNYVTVQLLAETPFVLDVVYSGEGQHPPQLVGEEYTLALRESARQFDQRFEETFGLGKKGYAEVDIAAAKAALSNMVGGIGYFYGAGRVRSARTPEPVPYWRAPLYTAVPSRSFFPRGFLWDEGFHGLLLGRWSPSIQLDIAAHWLDLINVEGWIPREQILGAEALARVPKEFVVQSNAAANPPMLLLQLAQLVAARPGLFQSGEHRATLDRMFPRLQAWYQWFQATQRGKEPTSYRWRGRVDDGLQLNPKTLTSGLDDYPRASHPTDVERHVDLRCWMFAAADAMVTIASALHRDTSKFEAMRDQLGDEALLNELHWSPVTQTYADYGLHTDAVRLVRQAPKAPNEQPKVVRLVSAPPKPRLVTSAFGYVSLFPMLLMVLKPESEKLGKILEDLDKPDLLWSPYGLRSLSKSSPLHMRRNTERDPPYWRGQVWLNINYLALRALRHYSAAGPYAQRAATLHLRLRDNLVRNVLTEYKRTGYFWEQYSSEDGHGSGCKPFTGWTALIVLIMADEY
ncbi:unnamed protein product, partial [Iphiclides podalirius]